MSELENIKSLEKYDAWKKAKESRKSYLSLLGAVIGIPLAILLTWLISGIHLGNVWTLGKGVFVSQEKVVEINEQVDKVEKKVEKSLLGGAWKWSSKKLQEDIASRIFIDRNAIIDGFRKYCVMMLAFWIVPFSLSIGLLIWLSAWIIGKFWWPEPTLTETFIKEKKKTVEL